MPHDCIEVEIMVVEFGQLWLMVSKKGYYITGMGLIPQERQKKSLISSIAETGLEVLGGSLELSLVSEASDKWLSEGSGISVPRLAQEFDDIHKYGSTV